MELYSHVAEISRSFEDNYSAMRYLVSISGMEYTCNRPPGAAGAMLVFAANPRLAVFGFVGPAAGPTCKEDGCMIEWSIDEDPIQYADAGGVDNFHPHCVRTIHAEQRAIFTAARYGLSTIDGTMYSILKPCFRCTQAIIAADIQRIVYTGKAYDEERTRNILNWAGVKCEKIDIGLKYGQ